MWTCVQQHKGTSAVKASAPIKRGQTWARRPSALECISQVSLFTFMFLLISPQQRGARAPPHAGTLAHTRRHTHAQKRKGESDREEQDTPRIFIDDHSTDVPQPPSPNTTRARHGHPRAQAHSHTHVHPLRMLAAHPPAPRLNADTRRDHHHHHHTSLVSPHCSPTHTHHTAAWPCVQPRPPHRGASPRTEGFTSTARQAPPTTSDIQHTHQPMLAQPLTHTPFPARGSDARGAPSCAAHPR